MSTPILHTKRLTLTPIKEKDVDAIFDCWMQDEDVSIYMCWKASDDIDDTREFVNYELENLCNEKWNRWIIELTVTGEIIGTCLI